MTWVRAAMAAGSIPAIRQATSTPAAIADKVTSGTVGNGGTPTLSAKPTHANRPATRPSGTPISTATVAITSAWTRTVVWSPVRVTPSAFKMASSRRRLRTDDTRARTSAASADTASSAARAMGPRRIWSKFRISAARLSGCS